VRVSVRVRSWDMLWDLAGRLEALNGLGKSLDVIRSFATAASNRVHQTVLCPLQKRCSHNSEPLV